MSKASRGFPGQRVMSRLFERMSARLTIGTSPAFFARFGLEDPWAMGPSGVAADGTDPFVFLSATAYYAHMDRLRARHRLMERFRAMEASANAAMALGEGRRARRGFGVPRYAASAQAMSSMFVLPPPILAESPAPESDESASHWVERRNNKGDKSRPEAKVARRAADRPIARALAQAPAESAAPLWRAVADAGVQLDPARRALVARTLVGVETLTAADQVAVARRVVRQIRGPQRRIAEAAIDEVAADQSEAPSRVATYRMAARATRKGLKPVLSASPALIGLKFEEPAPVETPAVEARRALKGVAPASAASRTAHRAVPVAAAAREARTQRVSGRAGPGEIIAAAPVAAPAVSRRAPTERVAARALAASRPAISEIVRGTAALEPAAPAASVAVSEAGVYGGSGRGEVVASSVMARAPRGIARVVARSRAAVPAIGESITAAPTAYLRERVTAGNAPERDDAQRSVRSVSERSAAPVRRSANVVDAGEYVA